MYIFSNPIQDKGKMTQAIRFWGLNSIKKVALTRYADHLRA
jgi:hypothetical protein